MVTRRHRFVNLQLGWMLIGTIVLALFDALTLDIFVLFSFMGLLVLVSLTAPRNITPTWRLRLKWLILFWFVVVTVVVTRRVLALMDGVWL